MGQIALPDQHPSPNIGAIPLMAILLEQESAKTWSIAERLARTNELLESHQESVFKYAFRLTGSRTAAEDLTQEVFLRVFKAVGQLRDRLAEKAWLMTITRNEFARWCKVTVANRGNLVPEELASCEENGLEELERDDWVQTALGQLPEEFRSVVLMYYFEQLSYAEISQRLAIPLGTVMSRLSRGKFHLKRCLDALSVPTQANSERKS